MGTKHHLFKTHRQGQSGNAVIYVLILIALFAALTFIMSRHSGTSETSALSKSQIAIDATQILQLPMQIKQAVDGMLFSGSHFDSLDFSLPSDAGYDTPPNTAKVFHPDGGGVILPPLPDHSTVAGTNPVPGWYMGRFNNVAWTPTTATDVILTAHHLNKDVCAAIDQKLTGDSTIPVATVGLNRVLIDASRHSSGNIDFSSAACPDCVGHVSLCVEEPSHDSWSFYSLIETR
jgi:hypothetical protein